MPTPNAAIINRATVPIVSIKLLWIALQAATGTTEKIHKKTPNAVRNACRLPALTKLLASSCVKVRLLSTGAEDCLLSPRVSASSSRLPNSEITVPTASFSLLPSMISSLYLSSIMPHSSSLAFKTSAVAGRLANIVSR